jgi:hypothetical protein
MNLIRICAAFKARVEPAMIAQQFGISQSDVRKSNRFGRPATQPNNFSDIGSPARVEKPQIMASSTPEAMLATV